MTYEEREKIFSKEALSVADVQALFGVCKSEATNIMNTIRRQTGDRLKVQGKIHIEDYLKHFGIEVDRYAKIFSDEKDDKKMSPSVAEEKSTHIPLIKSNNYIGATSRCRTSK